MFFDIGPIELIALIILAIFVFGPEKLPKLIQDVSRFIRKVRAFSDSAKEDIRSELGPEFKDFEFEDLNPKTFARKHLMDKDELGIKEIRNGFDLRKDLAEVTDAVNGRGADDSGAVPVRGSANGSSSASSSSASSSSASSSSSSSSSADADGSVRLDKDAGSGATHPAGDDRSPYDADAT